MSIKVSLILPSLNVVNYIRQCMDSVLMQTLSDIEILCIDAGSDDGTREILQEYANLDKRIRLIDSDIKSYGYQVNLGISLAHGEYIGIVETDDYVKKEMCEHLYDLAIKYDADVVCADTLIVDDAIGKNIERHMFSDCHVSRYFKKWENIDLLTRHCTAQNVWSGIYRRNFLLKRNIRCNESKGAAFQDIGFLQQIHTFAESIVFSNKALYCYRADRPGSSTAMPGWLRYVRQEWQFIIESGMCKQSEWEVHKRAVITRLVIAFISELRRSFIYSDYDYTCADWYDDYLWLRERTIQSVSEGMVIEYGLVLAVRKDLWLLINTEHGFFAAVKLAHCFPEYEADVLYCWADEQCVIFGCGALGKALCSFLLQSGRRVNGFVDNNPVLWGTDYESIKIYEPAELNGCLSDFSVIVCNKYYAEEICSQLRRLGICEDRIHIYNPNVNMNGSI